MDQRGPEGREALPPATRTCRVVLLHTDVEFLLGELGRVIIYITDPNVENQGIIHDLSCRAIHSIKVDLGSRALC